MSGVSGYKRCKCRDAEGHRELGATCPKLRRKDGSWNPSHGTWYGKAELPAPEKERLILRQGGFATQDEMTDWFEEALHLLLIPEKGPDGHDVRVQILALIKESRRQKAALPVYDDVKRRYAEGIAFKPGTTGAYLLRWLEQHHKAEDWSETTQLSYERTVHRRFLPSFGEVPLDKLRAKHILDMFGKVDAESDRIRAAHLSPDPEVRVSVAGVRPTGLSTKRRFLAVIRSALNEAMSASERLVTANVAEGIKLGARGKQPRPKPKLWTRERERVWREDFEARVATAGARGKIAQFRLWRNTAARPGPVMIWSPAQLGKFLDACEEERLYALFCIVAYCGLRRSEAVGLRWEDVDFESGTIAIEAPVVQVGWQTVIRQTKSEASEDFVRLPGIAVTALREWRKRQLEERISWGPAWADTGLIFTHEDGTGFHPAQVTTKFERITFDAELPPIRLHDLRHCAATIALAGGADLKAVSAMLRHSSVKITGDIYTSVLPELAKEVAESVASMIPRRAAAGSSSRTNGLPTVSRRG